MTERIDIQGPSAKTLMAQARARAKLAYVDWFQGQGAKIAAARPLPVFDACVLLALELSGSRSPLVLKADEIAKCEQRALSSARVRTFGALPRSEEEWHRQVASIREGWNTAASDEGKDRAQSAAPPS